MTQNNIVKIGKRMLILILFVAVSYFAAYGIVHFSDDDNDYDYTKYNELREQLEREKKSFLLDRPSKLEKIQAMQLCINAIQAECKKLMRFAEGEQLEALKIDIIEFKNLSDVLEAERIRIEATSISPQNTDKAQKAYNKFIKEFSRIQKDDYNSILQILFNGLSLINAYEQHLTKEQGREVKEKIETLIKMRGNVE